MEKVQHKKYIRGWPVYVMGGEMSRLDQSRVTSLHTHSSFPLEKELGHNPAIHMGFPGPTGGKEPICQCRRCKRHGFNPWVRKIPWKRACNPSNILAWRIPRIEEAGGLQSIGSHRTGQNWSDLACRHYYMCVCVYIHFWFAIYNCFESRKRVAFIQK